MTVELGKKKKSTWKNARESHILLSRHAAIFSCHHDCSTLLNLSYSINTLPTLYLFWTLRWKVSGSSLALHTEDDKDSLLKSICTCFIIKGHLLQSALAQHTSQPPILILCLFCSCPEESIDPVRSPRGNTKHQDLRQHTALIIQKSNLWYFRCI